MSKHFLYVAEQILIEFARPMYVEDIVKQAIDKGLLKTKGKTPTNTMRARLAEDIRKSNDTRFIRIGPNKFALKVWDLNEYDENPFQKNYLNETVVCFKQDSIDKIGRFFGFKTNYKPYLKALSNKENIKLCDRVTANSRLDLKQIVSYVILKDENGNFLSYVRGSYSAKDQLLKGVLCIGFGGHVKNIDYNSLFTIDDAGIKIAALREVGEEIKGLIPQNLRLIGVINDDSSPLGYNHFAFVFEGILNKRFNLLKTNTELSINKLNILNKEELIKRYHELEFWSQLSLKHYNTKDQKIESTIVIEKKRPVYVNPLVIVGEIGSGKSEIARQLSKKNNLPLIKTRNCISKLIGLEDFGTSERYSFQEKASKLISKKSGIKMIVDEIENSILRQENKLVIVDGIRNIDTLNLLKERFPKLILMYVEAPRDIGYEYYKNRSKDREVSINEFRNVRYHEVEKEVPLLKSRADIFIFNGGSLKELSNQVNKWWNGEL